MPCIAPMPRVTQWVSAARSVAITVSRRSRSPPTCSTAVTWGSSARARATVSRLPPAQSTLGDGKQSLPGRSERGRRGAADPGGARFGEPVPAAGHGDGVESEHRADLVPPGAGAICSACTRAWSTSSSARTTLCAESCSGSLPESCATQRPLRVSCDTGRLDGPGLRSCRIDGRNRIHGRAARWPSRRGGAAARRHGRAAGGRADGGGVRLRAAGPDARLRARSAHRRARRRGNTARGRPGEPPGRCGVHVPAGRGGAQRCRRDDRRGCPERGGQAARRGLRPACRGQSPARRLGRVPARHGHEGVRRPAGDGSRRGRARIRLRTTRRTRSRPSARW